MLTDVQQAFLALQLDGGGLFLHHHHRDAFPGLAELHRLGIAAVEGQYRGLVADDADQRDAFLGVRGAGQGQERKANKLAHR